MNLLCRNDGLERRRLDEDGQGWCRSVIRIRRRRSCRKNGAAGTTRSGGRTPAAAICPDTIICAAIDGGAPVSMSTPTSHAGMPGTWQSSTSRCAWRRLAAHDDPQHLVFVARADADGLRRVGQQRQQHVARHDLCRRRRRTASVDVRPSAWTKRRRSISPPGNAIRKLTSRTPLSRNDSRQRRQLGVQRARRDTSVRPAAGSPPPPRR